MARFVLEIGTEEIPPRYFPPALEQLGAGAATLLERGRLEHGEVKVYATPRRLALVVEEVAEKQRPATREERGPAARVAFDEAGKPTKAALGFARRHGLSPEQLTVRETDQGEYVFALIEEAELGAAEALAGGLPELIADLSFPKSMRWGTGKLRFGRPIRWLLCLLDEDVVDFELEGLRSGRRTRGHPVLADGMFEVARAQEYEERLAERFVLVLPEERRARIGQALEKIAESESARLIEDGLIEDTTFLVEHPTAACGSFDPAFLRLPRPVLVEEMQHVQSYFPLEGEDGKLLPRFIAVRDGGEEHLDTVLAGWESVLRAKLIDADYFYHEDLKKPLADWVEALKGVAFHERLGTMYDKMERVRAVARAAAEQRGLDSAERKALDRAAYLCKADLTTQMVTELSSLQGQIGGEYARTSGEPEMVADAIGEHYRPRFGGDALPQTSLGRLLALSDKLDTVVACVAAGILPTGSADPYGLRREATGIVRILSDFKPGELSLHGVVEAALTTLAGQVEVERGAGEIEADVLDLLRQRLETQLREEEGIRYDLVAAALAVGIDDISEAGARARALQRLAGDESFLPVVVASTRVSNIVKGFSGGAVDASLFEHESERALWDRYQAALPEVESQAQRGEYVELFGTLGRLREPIDRYFEDVLVLAEDEKLRRNRLAMCWQLTQLFRRLGDLSLVVQA